MRIGAGRFKNALLPHVGEGVRPVPGRLRQSLFTVIHPYLAGARVLDLCAGVGGLGLEALSRGAKSLVLVERDPRGVEALRRWVAEYGIEAEVAVVRADASRGGWPRGPYDLVFLDPPFDVWQVGERGRAFLAPAVEALGPEGILAVKLPAGVQPPEDPRWTVLKRQVHGDVAYALFARATDPSAGDPSGGADPAPAGPP